MSASRLLSQVAVLGLLLGLTGLTGCNEESNASSMFAQGGSDTDTSPQQRPDHQTTTEIIPVDSNANPVPEPASALLFGVGALGIAGYRRFKNRRHQA